MLSETYVPSQLLLDYDDLMKLPYFKTFTQELTNEADKLRYICMSFSIFLILRWFFLWHANKIDNFSNCAS